MSSSAKEVGVGGILCRLALAETALSVGGGEGNGQGEMLEERVPLCHRPTRVLQHFVPVFASLAVEHGAQPAAAHQLVTADSAAYTE